MHPHCLIRVLIFLWILGNLKNDIQADLSIYSAYIMSFQIKFALRFFGTFTGQATFIFIFASHPIGANSFL